MTPELPVTKIQYLLYGNDQISSRLWYISGLKYEVKPIGSRKYQYVQ